MDKKIIDEITKKYFEDKFNAESKDSFEDISKYWGLSQNKTQTNNSPINTPATNDTNTTPETIPPSDKDTNTTLVPDNEKRKITDKEFLALCNFSNLRFAI